MRQRQLGAVARPEFDDTLDIVGCDEVVDDIGFERREAVVRPCALISPAPVALLPVVP